MDGNIDSERLIDVFPDSVNTKIYLLASGPNGSDTALGKLASKRSGRETANQVYTVLKQISRVGVEMFSQSPKEFRRIDTDLVEIKIRKSVVRAMCYQRNGTEIVVVIDIFRGHQGSGNIHKEIDKAKRKVPVIEDLIGALDNTGVHG